MHLASTRYGLQNLSDSSRSEGVHASTLLDRLCVRFGHYEKKVNKSTGQVDPVSDINRELGHALEDTIASKIDKKHSGKYLHNPEIECDGIFCTPDLVFVDRKVDREIKLTRMSPTDDPFDQKLWRYLEQGKSYLYAVRRVGEGTARMRRCESSTWLQGRAAKIPRDWYTTLELTVCFINDYRPIDRQIPTWTIEFHIDELATSWEILKAEKLRLEREKIV